MEDEEGFNEIVAHLKTRAGEKYPGWAVVTKDSAKSLLHAVIDGDYGYIPPGKFCTWYKQ